jgi:hypothetical protein
LRTAWIEIKDREPTVRKGDSGDDAEAVAIGAPVCRKGVHLAQLPFGNHASPPVDDAADPAHGSQNLPDGGG